MAQVYAAAVMEPPAAVNLLCSVHAFWHACRQRVTLAYRRPIGWVSLNPFSVEVNFWRARMKGDSHAA